MLVLEGSANLCVLMNLESAVCACTSDLRLPAEEEEGTWLSVFICMRILYVGAVEGSVLSVASRASVRVPVCVCVSLACIRSLLLVQPANGKVTAASLSPGRGPGTLGWAPVVGQEGPGLKRLEEAAVHLTSLNRPVS